MKGVLGAVLLAILGLLVLCSKISVGVCVILFATFGLFGGCFSCFACCCASCGKSWVACSQLRYTGIARSNHQCSFAVWGHRCRWIFILLCTFCWRVGEASNPGPPTDVGVWTCGLFNPSGLTNKVDYAASLPGDVWLGAETHLTAFGVSQLCAGFRAQGSRYKAVVAGAPCQCRTKSDFGGYAGVVALSAFPARALPHSVDPDLYGRSRLLFGGVAVNQAWLQVGLMYGYPHSTAHQNRTYQTECLLDALITRIAVQGVGPRMVCGDMNHGMDALVQHQRLRQLGFREVQELALERWGQQPCPTASGQGIIDQMWLSPELQALLVQVEVNWELWADHAAVIATFRHVTCEFDRYVWKQPLPFPWPSEWDPQCSVDWTSPSVAYASWWFQLETSACRSRGAAVAPSSCGRGQTLEPLVSKLQIAPCKLGRSGDLQPEYYGSSVQHVRWFRQLRRLHALVRGLRKSPVHAEAHVKLVELWTSIRHAVGFPGGFGQWWILCYPGVPFHCYLPWWLPTAEQATSMFELFRGDVRKLEQSLGASRLAAAKARRLDDASLAFRDCMKDGVAPVDSLVSTIELCVDEVKAEDVSVVLRDPVSLRDGLPVLANGRRYQVMAACEDQVWLDSVENLCPGDVMRQDFVASTDAAVLAEFEGVWKDRWYKFSHVPCGQWNQVAAFCQQHFVPLTWNFAPWTLERVKAGLAHKKARAATGPDGVSRRDLLALPDAGLAPALDLFASLEAGGRWPQQLVQGYVNCLDKQKGSGLVDSYRPIVIYPLLTRLWSTVRAREALRAVAPCLPGGLHGGVPSKQSKSIWFHLAQLVELSHFQGSSLQGLAVDVQRAFNNLPREPIWQVLVQIGLPQCVFRPWAAFLAAQERRFRIRGSTGNPLPSNVGFPEGCAWSVFAMAIADWMLEVWSSAQLVTPHDLYSFVDDWHIVFLDAGAFDLIWASLGRFASAMDLTLDFSKSFCWASQSADRKLLCGAPIATVFAARDLGAHQNFTRRSGNRTVVDRIESLTQFWPKLRRCVSPYRIKLQVVLQMAWPRAFHGVSIVHVGACHFTTLRAGLMRALKVNRVGANPYLHLMAHGVSCDPEGWTILQTLRELREVGSTAQMLAMLDFASHGLVIPPNGPAAVLLARLVRLGWTLHPGGVICDVFGRVNLFGLSWPALLARVQWSWPRVVAAELAHRSSFSGIQYCDVSETRKVLSKLGDADHSLMLCCLNGTLYQDLHKKKQERGTGSRCTFCGEVDSIFHRVWLCPFFESCREQSKFRSVVAEVPPCLSCHGWPLVPSAWYRLSAYTSFR